MAENYSLVVELEGYQKFIDQAGSIDETIAKVGKNLETLASKFTKLDFGTVKFDTKSLEALANLDLKGKSQSLAAVAKQYGALGEAVKTVDAAKLAEVNKALGAGAKKETIEGKATAIGALYTELKRFEKLQLGIVPEQLRRIFESLKVTASFDADKIGQVHVAIAALAKGMAKLEGIKVSDDSIRQINLLSVALSNISNSETISKLGQLAPKVKELANAFLTFGKDTKSFDASILAKNINVSIEALMKFTALAKSFGAGVFGGKTLENFHNMANAVRELAKAFIEFKSPTEPFDNVGKNVTATITALKNLKDEFSQFGGGTTKVVKEVAESFRAIGEAATSLGSRTKSFEKLPDNIEKLNQALLNLNVKRLEEIAPTLERVAPALRSMSDLATVTGSVFTRMSSEVKTSTSGFNYFATIANVAKGSFSVISTTLSGLIGVFKTLSPLLFTVAKGFLTLPFDVVTSSVKTFAAVLLSPIRLLEWLGRTTIAFAREIRLLEIGLKTLLLPFKALEGLIALLGKTFNGFVAIIQKIAGSFDNFLTSGSKAKKEIEFFGTSAETTKAKAQALGTTLDSLDDKAAPVSVAFKQIGQSVDSSIDDSDTAKFVRFSSSLQAITTIGNAVMSTLSSMINSFKQFFAAGFEASASIENVQKSLNTLSAGDLMRRQADGALTLESALNQTEQASKDLLDRYQLLGFQSIFSRQQLTDAHQLAQSLGFTTDEAESLVRQTADWAAANGLSGDSIKALILPLGQMRSLTKANTVDMKQLITAGNVPAFELLRNELERLTGTQVSMTKVQELLSAGMIDSDTALRAVMAGFKTFDGAATKATGTLSGLANAFGDAKENIIRGFFEPLLSQEEGLRGAFTNLLSAENIIGATNAAREFGKVFAANVVGVVNRVVAGFKLLMAIWQAIPGPIQESIFFGLKFAAMTAAIASGIFVVTASLSALVTGFGLFVGAVPLATAAVAAFITTFVTNFDVVRGSIAQVLYSFSEMRGIVLSVGKALQQSFNTGVVDPKVFDDLSSLSQSLAQGLTSGLSEVGSALVSTFNLVKTWVGQFEDLAVNMFRWGNETILAFANGVMAGVGAIYNAIASIVKIFTEWFQPHSPPKVASDIDVWGEETAHVYTTGLQKGFLDGFRNVEVSVSAAFGALLSTFKTIASVGIFSVINAIVAGFSALSDVGSILILPAKLLLTTASALLDSLLVIVLGASSPFLTLEAKVYTTIAAIANFITKTFDGVVDFMAGFVASMLRLVSTFTNFFAMEFDIIGDSLLTSFPNTLGGVGKALSDFGSELSSGMEVASASVNRDVEDLGTKVKQNFANVMVDAVTSLLDPVTKGFSPTILTLANGVRLLQNVAVGLFNVFTGIGNFAVFSLVNAFQLLGTILNETLNIILAVAYGVANQIAIAIKTIVNTVEILADPFLSAGDKIKNIFELLGFSVEATLNNIVTTAQSVFGSISNIFSSFSAFGANELLLTFQSLGIAFPSIFGNIQQDVETFVNNASTALANFTTNTSDNFASLLSAVADYGYGLISAFADGIYAAVDIVADALSAMGDMISYWLAPGSPPNLLPDIDDWGTAAAQEFIDGFSEADLQTITNFGNTIEQTLEKLDVGDVNVEEVTRAFATGLDNLNRGGEFGSDVMERIVALTADAGPEVQALTSKFKTLAEEQAKLNRTTSLYNAELAKAQGTLDTLNANEEIDANAAKIEALQNALTNTYLTTEERTKIQTQIDKLQATNKIKQLEQQKKAQEESVKTVTDSIDTQKKLLDLSDEFDGDKQASAVTKIGEAASKSAKNVTDKFTKLQLQQRLAGKTTEEQIAIYKEYLSTLEDGSEEYIKTQTKIIELEAKLGKERESANKKLGKTAQLAEEFGSALAGGGSPFASLTKDINNKTAEIEKTINGTVKRVQDTWSLFVASFSFSRMSDISVPIDFSTLQKSVISIGSLIGKVAKAIDLAISYIDKYVVKNDIVRNALIALATVLTAGGIALKIKGIALAVGALLTPFNLAVVAVTLLGSAIFTFVQQSGGFSQTIQRIGDAWSGLTSAFSNSATGGEAALDFSSFEGVASSIGTVLGQAFSSVKEKFTKFYDNLSLAWQGAITNLQTSISDTWTNFTGLFSKLSFDLSGLKKVQEFFSKNWLEIMSGVADVIIGITLGRWLLIVRGIALVLQNFSLPTDVLTEVFVNFVNSIDNYIVKPVADAFASNSTLLGKISGALSKFYYGVLQVISTSVQGAFKRFGSGKFLANLNNFFDNTAIGKAVERNLNEAVVNIVPNLSASFDLSTFINQMFAQFGNAVAAVKAFVSDIKAAFSTGILANILNENKSAFSEFISEITSPAFLQSLSTIGKALGIVAGAVLALGAAIIDVALVGVLRNIADLFIVVGQGLDRVFAGFQQLISGDVLGGVSEIFGGIFDVVNGVFDTIGQTVADTVLAMVSFFNPEWAKTLDPIVSAISKIIVGFLGWQGTFTKVFSALGGFFSRLLPWFWKTQKATQGTTSLFSKFQTILAPFKTVVANVGNAFKNGVTNLQKFGETVPYLRGVLSALYRVLEVLASPLKPLYAGLQNLISAFGGANVTGSFLGTAFERLKSGLGLLSEAFALVWSWAKTAYSAFVGLAAPVQQFFLSIGRAAASLLRFVDSILGAVAHSTVLRTVITWVADVFTAILGVFRAVGLALFSVGRWFFNLTANVLAALKPLETVKALIQGLTLFVSFLGSALSRAVVNVLAFGTTLYTAVNDGIQSLLAMDFVQQFITWSSGWVDAIWTGLATFVTSLPEKITSWTTAFTEWLAPNSPPKFLPELANWGKAIALVLLQAMVDAPLDLITTLGTNIGTAILTFDWLQFATELGTKISGLFTSAIATVVAIPTTLSQFVNVTETEEGEFAQNIRDALPNFDAVFGEGVNEKISVGLADLVTFNQAEISTATDYFKQFFDALVGFANVQAIPEAFTTSLSTIIGFFQGDITFPEAIKTVVAELGKVVNLTAIPEIFTSGLNSIITLFSENSTIGTVVQSVVTALGQFAALVGVPEGVVTSISNIFSFLSGEDVDATSANAVAETLKQFGNLTGIPVSVKESLETVFGFFSENTTITTTIDAVSTALGRFNTLTGLGTGFAESFTAVFDLFSGEATFPQTVERISTALSGIVTTLQSTLTNPFDALDFAAFSTTIENIQTVLDNIFTAFQNLTTIDLSGISSAFEPLTSLFDTVGQQIENIKTGLSFIPGVNLTGAEVEGEEEVTTDVQTNLQSALDDKTLPLETRISIITDETNLSEEAAKALVAMSDALATNATYIFGQQTGDNLSTVVNDYLKAGFKPEDFKKIAEEAGVQVPAGFEEAFKNPENWSGANTEAGNQMVAVLDEVKKKLGIESPSTVARDEIGLMIIQGIADGLKLLTGVDFAGPITEVMTTILTTAQTQLATLSANINLAASIFTLDEAIVAQTTAGVNQFVEIFTAGFESVLTLITESLEEWTELFEEFFETLLDMADEFVSAFVAAFEDLKTQVSDKIRSLISAIKSFKQQFYDAGKELASKLIDGIKDFLGEDGAGRASVESAVKGLASFISSSNEAITTAFANAGKSFAKPFVEGIAAGIDAERSNGALKQAINNLVTRIIEIAKQAAGVKSPSTEARDQVGIPIAQGVAVGITQGAVFLDAAVNELIDGITLQNASIGESFNRGVANGIADTTNVVTDAVKLMATSGVEAARQALDINSPSKVTEKLIGLPFVQGIAKALSSGKAMLTPLTSDLLSILPNDAKFKLDVAPNLEQLRLQEQSIDVKYDGLLNALPTLSQDVTLNRSQVNAAKAIAMQHNISTIATNRVTQSFLQGMNKAYISVAPHIAVMAEAQRAKLGSSVASIVVPHQLEKQQVLANNTHMSDNRTTVVNNHQEYHMHLTTTEGRAARRVQKNFNSMRYGYRFR